MLGCFADFKYQPLQGDVAARNDIKIVTIKLNSQKAWSKDLIDKILYLPL